MTKVVDVAIVGAGPAGGSAANALALSGLNVLVLEKDQMPRSKPCGGLMPAMVQQWLDCDLSPFAGSPVQHVLNLNNYLQPVERRLSPDSLLLVDRAHFDAYLIDQARERSGQLVGLKQGFVLKKAKETSEGVTLIARNGEQVEARYVIAADGVASRTARSLGLSFKPDLAVAIDAELEVSEACWERESKRLTFNYFCLSGGYGWIFPKQRPRLSCGVGCWRGKADVRIELNKFLERSIPPNQRLSMRESAFALPIWSGAGRISTRRVALVGDAAGLVDPISGEGIRYAIISGRLAAKAAIKALQNREASGLLTYPDSLYARLQESLDMKRRFVFLPFMQSPDFFYEQFVAGAQGAALGLDHMAGGYDVAKI